jgi:hypothetical protein
VLQGDRHPTDVLFAVDSVYSCVVIHLLNSFNFKKQFFFGCVKTKNLGSIVLYLVSKSLKEKYISKEFFNLLVFGEIW